METMKITTSPFERDPLRRLKKYLNRENLPRNWEQYVLGFEQLKPKRNESNALKNKLIKNTKLRLLKKFLNQNTLPTNWERYVRTHFQNVNKVNLNTEIMIRKFKNVPIQKKQTHVPRLQNYILKTLRRKNNQPLYLNVGNRRVHLTHQNYATMKPSAKNIVFAKNIQNYSNLIREALKRGARLHPSTLTALVRNQQKHKNMLRKRFGINVNRQSNNPAHVQMNKNYLNRLAMIKRIYSPSEPRYRSIVSDVFASAYKLLHTYKNKLNKSGGFIYPPLYFRARFPGFEPNRKTMYNSVNIVYREIETIDDLEDYITSFKEIFMKTPVLHASKNRRALIWRTLENCKGSMASCIKQCNEIYYGRLKNRTPRRSILT